MTLIRDYTTLSKLKTFEERFEYLKLAGKVGIETFGYDRPINQLFYRSPEWQSVRNYVIDRDNGFDLGAMDYEIVGRAIVHHMNPITIDDFEDPEAIMNPEFLILTSVQTHRAIHFGVSHLPPRLPPVRKPGDTKLW